MGYLIMRQCRRRQAPPCCGLCIGGSSMCNCKAVNVDGMALVIFPEMVTGLQPTYMVLSKKSTYEIKMIHTKKDKVTLMNISSLIKLANVKLHPKQDCYIFIIQWIQDHNLVCINDCRRQHYRVSKSIYYAVFNIAAI